MPPIPQPHRPVFVGAGLPREEARTFSAPAPRHRNPKPTVYHPHSKSLKSYVARCPPAPRPSGVAPDRHGQTDSDIVTQAKPLALLAFALTLTACSNSPAPQPTSNLGWNTPAMQLGGDNGLPLRTESPCRKRGCDNDKLFFNPGKTEPNVNTIHRGW